MSKKYFSKGFLLTLLLVLSSLLFTNTAIGLDLQLRVKVDSAKIRLNALQESPVVGTISKGEIINTDTDKGDWYLITFKDKETGFSLSGYIHKTDVEVMGEEQVTKKGTELREETEAKPIQRELVFEEKSKKVRKGFPLSFYLSGNYRFVNGEDLNSWIDSYEELYSDADEYFTWNKLKNVPEVNFEIIYNISEYFGFGIGIGYLFRSNYANYGWELSDGDYLDYTRNIDLNALVFSGNIHGNIPLGNTFAINLTAGGDFYLGKYKQILESDWDYWYTNLIFFPPWYFVWVYTHSIGNTEREEDTTCNTFGFHVGAALDINISPSIAIVIGGFYKLIKFNNFFGTYNYENKKTDYTNSYEGYLWYNTEDPYMRIYEDAPTDQRKAVIDLSGFSIQLGIRISNLFSKKK